MAEPDRLVAPQTLSSEGAQQVHVSLTHNTNRGVYFMRQTQEQCVEERSQQPYQIFNCMSINECKRVSDGKRAASQQECEML